ncbi:MAG: hypothetical protein ACYTFW_05195 [Planctomycetota bacterium]
MTKSQLVFHEPAPGEIGEWEDFQPLYRCGCGSTFLYSDLENYANGDDATIDYWFLTETCPDCAGG